MSQKKKNSLASIIILILLIIVSIVLGVFLFITHKNLTQTTASLKQTIAEKDSLQQELEKLNYEKDNLQHSLHTKNGEISNLKSNLKKQEKELMEKKKRLEYVNLELKRLQEIYGKEKQERIRVAMDLVRVQEEYNRTKNTINQMQVAKKALEEKLRQVLQESETTSSIHTAEGEVQVINPGELTGDVLAVNREYNFVVIDIGQRDGAAVGQTYDVIRDQDMIGRVKVQKVYDNMSAADILSEEPNLEIQKSDIVQLS